MATKPSFMLDTNICIYIQRRKPLSILERFKIMRRGEAVISVVTWGELLYGAAKCRDPGHVVILLEEFISYVPVLPMLPIYGKHYGELRAILEKKGQTIGNNDLWIAAHAVGAELSLVTNNIREFERIPGLDIENWIQS